jgi:hypothetical protein
MADYLVKTIQSEDHSNGLKPLFRLIYQTFLGSL